ncbi:MAG: hydantoinase/oxoprolinase N-terminal domain-containing protein [Arthrobacter sp.]
MPGNLSAGVIAGLESVVSDLSEIEFLVHGTTQGLNAFLESRGVPVLLLVTAEIEDTYHIARGPAWSSTTPSTASWSRWCAKRRHRRRRAIQRPGNEI